MADTALAQLDAASSTSRKPRQGTALCLSGGGYRAALFHLGALRRLNELGLLSRVDTVCSVSGGSIAAAALAQSIATQATATVPGQPLSSFESFAAALRQFTRHNIRTKPILKRLTPWNWFKDDTAVQALADTYTHKLIPLRLGQLPERPQFLFCSTDMAFGVAWHFSRESVGDYQAGYLGAERADRQAGEAVAASSCFPPVFNPLRPRLDPAALKAGRYPAGDYRDKLIRGLRLSDGGVYDNMGLEPVWKSREVVMVSDGGGTFGFTPDTNLRSRLQRYTDIVGNQAHALRVRWLIDLYERREFAGAYWGIAGGRTPEAPVPQQGFPVELAAGLIAKIRTDLDAFSDAESGVLQNHGYSVADAAIAKYGAGAHIPADAPFRAPVPEWDWNHLSEVQLALADSAKRSWLGRN